MIETLGIIPGQQGSGESAPNRVAKNCRGTTILGCGDLAIRRLCWRFLPALEAPSAAHNSAPSPSAVRAAIHLRLRIPVHRLREVSPPLSRQFPKSSLATDDPGTPPLLASIGSKHFPTGSYTAPRLVRRSGRRCSASPADEQPSSLSRNPAGVQTLPTLSAGPRQRRPRARHAWRIGSAAENPPVRPSSSASVPCAPRPVAPALHPWSA